MLLSRLLPPSQVFGASAERLKKQEKAAEEEARHKEERTAKKATWKAQHEGGLTRELSPRTHAART